MSSNAEQACLKLDTMPDHKKPDAVKANRALLAEETMKILKRGGYTNPNGRWVDLRTRITSCAESTRILSLNSPEIRATATSRTRFPTISVSNETTTQGIFRLGPSTPANKLGALNFASAKSPGGGFLRGAIAQEEDITIASALYASLERADEFYKENKAFESPLYRDLAILSRNVPFFRTADWSLAVEPQNTTIITCAAPNRGAIERVDAASAPHIPGALRRRIKLILLAAHAAEVHTLILGAWGCGVFGNIPLEVAEHFRDGIAEWGPGLARIHFSVLDKSANGDIISPFEKTLRP